MNATADMETPAVEHKPARPEPKVNMPHPWAGRMVFYWRMVNPLTGELSALPAMLLEPARGPVANPDGWDLNFYGRGKMQGRSGVKFSEKPRAGFWTWGPQGAPKVGK